MGAKGIPWQVQNVLTQDENVEQHFGLQDCIICIMDECILKLKECRIRDFDYAHISTIVYSSRKYQ